MLRIVLGIFFAGQIIAEKLASELKAKYDEINEQIKCNSQGDREQNIETARKAVKRDYEQVSAAAQNLLQNLGDLASAYVPVKLPFQQSECSSAIRGNKKHNHKDDRHAESGAEPAYKMKH